MASLVAPRWFVACIRLGLGLGRSIRKHGPRSAAVLFFFSLSSVASHQNWKDQATIIVLTSQAHHGDLISIPVMSCRLVLFISTDILPPSYPVAFSFAVCLRLPDCPDFLNRTIGNECARLKMGEALR